MRIGIVTQYYRPEIGAPQVRLSSLAQSFVSRGHEVVVLTAMPNYPQGRVYEGYGGVFRRDVVDGIPVVRTWVYPSRSPSMLRRSACYLSFAASSLLGGIAALPRLDVVMTESPPLFLAPAGWLLAKAKGAKFVLNVSDLWPDTLEVLGMADPKSLPMRLGRALEKFSYARAWLLTGQTGGIVETLAARSRRAPAHRFTNGVDCDLFSPAQRSQAVRDRHGVGDRTFIVYAGLHGVAQGLDQVIDAAARLERPDEVLILLVGDGPEKIALQQRATSLGVTNVRFADPVAHTEVPALLASADAALVPLRVPIKEAVPSKLYEAMASGVPVIVVADTEAANMVAQARGGLAVSPGDLAGLARALERVARDPAARADMGRAGRAYVLERYDRRLINDQLVSLFETSLALGKPPPPLAT